MRRLTGWTVVLCLIFLSAGPAATASAETNGGETDKISGAKSAIVIEQETGKILYKLNEHKQLPPASMTKVMTLLLIFKALTDGDIALNDKVTVSEHAASMGGSQVFLEPGEVMTVDEMLKAIVIASANDASAAMAEHVAGSESAFVRKMNDEAKAMELSDTHFKNPTGLPEEGHVTSAHDMAQMARALARYEKVFSYSSRYEDYLREDTEHKFWLVNTNKLIKTYPGADGLKTGYTNEAKYCLTATAKRNGMRVIAVVMGAESAKERNKTVSALMDEAFAMYSTKLLIGKDKAVGVARVNKGDRRQVTVWTQKPSVLLLKKGEDAKGLKESFELTEPIQAPVRSGTVVGYYTVKKDGQVVARTPLIVKQNIEPSSWWQLFKRSAGSIMGH